eukprot:1332174-Ditylum_brightwellii.AAC.1
MKKIEVKEVDYGSDNKLDQDNIEIPKASPHQKHVAIVDKTPSKLDDQSKNAAPASQESSIASSIESIPLSTSCFTVNDDATLTKDNKRRLAHVLKKSKKYIKRMHCCNEHQMQERFDKRIARIVSGVNISTK